MVDLVQSTLALLSQILIITLMTKQELEAIASQLVAEAEEASANWFRLSTAYGQYSDETIETAREEAEQASSLAEAARKAANEAT